MGQRSQGSLGSAMTGVMETPATAVIPDLGTNGDHGQAADKMEPERQRLGRDDRKQGPTLLTGGGCWAMWLGHILEGA